jgi:hypothetical protein
MPANFRAIVRIAGQILGKELFFVEQPPNELFPDSVAPIEGATPKHSRDVGPTPGTLSISWSWCRQTSERRTAPSTITLDALKPLTQVIDMTRDLVPHPTAGVLQAVALGVNHVPATPCAGRTVPCAGG